MSAVENSPDPTGKRAQGGEKSPAALIAAVPIVLVNALAVIGQCQWAGTHLHWGRPGQALFAGALETTALAVMYLAHTALIEGDSAWRQKMFAYLIAVGSASVNWQEHSNDWHPTPAAAVFAGASLLSPILWATYSRFAARTVMRDAGLIDRRAAKFSFARWIMFPRRTFKALRYSVWNSVQSPTDAIAASHAQDCDSAPAPAVEERADAPRPRTAEAAASASKPENAPTAPLPRLDAAATTAPEGAPDTTAPRTAAPAETAGRDRAQGAPAPAAAPKPAPSSARMSTPTDRQRTIRRLILEHGRDNVDGAMVGKALGVHRSNGRIALKTFLEALDDGRISLDEDADESDRELVAA